MISPPPRKGLELGLMKTGRTGALLEPRCRPQAGKCGHPHSQNPDSSPRAQGALGLGLAAKPKGKCGAPWAPTAYGLSCCVAADWTWASPLPHAASATARLDKSLRHARKTIITCDHGRRWLAFSRYKWGGAEPPSPISSSLACFFLLALLLAPMAPIRRFSVEEKGKAPRDVPEPLPPKKRSVHHRDEAVMQVVTRPWCERPPPGYPLPLYA